MKNKTRSKQTLAESAPTSTAVLPPATPPSPNGTPALLSKEERIATILDIQKQFPVVSSGKRNGSINWKAAFAAQPDLMAKLGVAGSDAKSMGKLYAFASHVLKDAGVATSNKGKRNLPARRHADVFASPTMPHYFGGAGAPGVVSQAIFAASQEVMAATFEGLMKAQNALARLNQTTIMAAQVQHAA